LVGLFLMQVSKRDLIRHPASASRNFSGQPASASRNVSGPGEARTILLLHIISVRPSKQLLMVRTFLKVYMELGSYFLFLQEQIKDIIIIRQPASASQKNSGYQVTVSAHDCVSAPLWRCVYYCSTYCKAVREGGGGGTRY
jgi:hypothetical protein